MRRDDEAFLTLRLDIGGCAQGRRVAGDGHQQAARVVGLGDAVRSGDGGPLIGGFDDDGGVNAEALGHGAAKGGGAEPALHVEHRIAAVQQGAHLRGAELGEQGRQVGHREALGAADIDAAPQSDAAHAQPARRATHRPRLSAARLRPPRLACNEAITSAGARSARPWARGAGRPGAAAWPSGCGTVAGNAVVCMPAVCASARAGRIGSCPQVDRARDRGPDVVIVNSRRGLQPRHPRVRVVP
mmetsp:Transcript_12836/g.29912  ORF Transcript_12836/g.29912 Transcript_12836/m.29912 type:complete len:243 (+) Transcript_12836:259-987(+)